MSNLTTDALFATMATLLAVSGGGMVLGGETLGEIGLLIVLVLAGIAIVVGLVAVWTVFSEIYSGLSDNRWIRMGLILWVGLTFLLVILASM
jgi:hypothetical protein